MLEIKRCSGPARILIQGAVVSLRETIKIAVADGSGNKIASLAWTERLGEGHFDYVRLETGISEPLPEPRLGRRTVLTFPLLPPPQKN